MKVYLDASVFLGAVLREPGAIENWSDWDLIVSSRLLRTEAFRKLDRLRLQGRFADTELAEKLNLVRNLITTLEVIPLTPAVLERAASPFPTLLGTLDAIHLASALLWIEDHGEPLTLLTYDAELAIAAQACGLEVRRLRLCPAKVGGPD